jgi:hypothetical protein
MSFLLVLCSAKRDTVKLPGTPAKPLIPLFEETQMLHLGESRGYGKNSAG